MLRAERPIAAFAIGLTAGLIILVAGVIVGAALLVLGAVTTPPSPLMLYGGLLSIVVGVPIIIGSVMVYVNPGNHAVWGIVVLAFSIASYFTPAYGGFYVGFILGLVGGILGISWTPTAKSTALTKTCQTCGKIMEVDAKHCSNCGKAF